MSKRPPNKSLSKQGGNPSKKVKTDGPDIPMSNFAPQKGKPAPKYSKVVPSMITSLPSNKQNIKNPNQVLRTMDLPDIYKEALGPNIAELKKHHEEKKKREMLALSRVDKAKIPLIEKMKADQNDESEYKPKEIIQDEAGRIVDKEGNIINLRRDNAYTSKANINKAKEERVKDLLKLQKTSLLTTSRGSKLFDPNLLSKSQSLRLKRKNNAFHFVEKGSISKKGEVLRSQLDESLGATAGNKDMVVENDTLGKLQQKLATSEPQIEIRRSNVRVKRHDPIPDVEWWDVPILFPDRRSYLPEEYLVKEKEVTQKEKYEGDKDKKMEEISNNADQNDKKEESLVDRLNRNLEMLESTLSLDNLLYKDKINNMIEHPASFKTDASGQNIVIPAYLTKDERKKLRRKKRIEKEKDKQEKIRLGLMKAPPPKLKYSNFMNIMKDEAVADPTRVEMEIKKATQERLQAHLQRNASRKLTKEQKAEKHMRKLRRDSALECRVAVFRVENLSHGAHKFKVNMNAQQLALNGVCIIADKKHGLSLPNVVVVEGGPKAIKFYKKLMLRRIQWNLKSQKEALATGEGENAVEKKQPHGENKCTLVWEGILKDHNFNKWKVAEIKSELEGRRILSDRGVEFYWDRALTSSAFEDEES